MQVRPSGPTNAKIMVVGEAPGEQEVAAGVPFVGPSGNELNRMLQEAGIARTACFVTNVIRERPPGNDISAFIPARKRDITPDCIQVDGKWVKPCVAAGIELLEKEISLVQPNVIIALGNVSLWATTGKWGVGSWRGSTLRSPLGPVVVPTLHPAYVLRDWSVRAAVVHDLRRAAAHSSSREIVAPTWRFLIRPSFKSAVAAIAHAQSLCDAAPTKLAVDIETRGGHIACLGFAWSKEDAICLPFMCVENVEGYWSCDEEASIVLALSRLLQHPNAQIVGQNFSYDAQYIWRHWHFMPHFVRDTMIAQHSCFSAQPKGLDYLSSLYCAHHVYWKDDGKEWHGEGEDVLWRYNCEDCVRTYEVDEVEQQLVDNLGLREHDDFQQSMFWPVSWTMRRGLRVDKHRRNEFAMHLSSEIAIREQRYIDLLGHPLNPASPLQMQRLFYSDLNQKVVLSRKTHKPTLDDEALETLKRREPLLIPLINNIQEHRSLGVFLSTFVNAAIGWDGRMHCSYNIAGTTTYRLSSSTDAFGSGMNLQNIPAGSDDPNALKLPNIRALFIPDEGYELFDMDQQGADFYVVVWEADDADFKEALAAGLDIHGLNAKELFSLSCAAQEVKKLHPAKRYFAKRWVHGTNYGGSARTMAVSCGITLHEADRLQRRWFQMHPGIKHWHERTEDQLKAYRYVENKLGARRYFFDRIEGVLPEALAWVPQSTVALITNRIWKRLYDNYRWIEVLLQGHDSLAGQYPLARREEALTILREACKITVPYSDPLIIPLGIKTSTSSWGECE